MTAQQQALYQKIKSFELDDTNAPFCFTDRLARENGWSLEYAVRTVAEYKKFMFLICLAEHPLTPSDQVDQVWHLHLIYTRSYWEEFCGATLGKIIHHGPTKGRSSEAAKYQDWYEKTKQLYETKFLHKPPVDIWPSSKDRFSKPNFRRVNLDDYWMIKKPKF